MRVDAFASRLSSRGRRFACLVTGVVLNTSKDILPTDACLPEQCSRRISDGVMLTAHFCHPVQAEGSPSMLAPRPAPQGARESAYLRFLPLPLQRHGCTAWLTACDSLHVAFRVPGFLVVRCAAVPAESAADAAELISPQIKGQNCVGVKRGTESRVLDPRLIPVNSFSPCWMRATAQALRLVLGPAMCLILCVLPGLRFL